MRRMHYSNQHVSEYPEVLPRARGVARVALCNEGLLLPLLTLHHVSYLRQHVAVYTCM